MVNSKESGYFDLGNERDGGKHLREDKKGISAKKIIILITFFGKD